VTGVQTCALPIYPVAVDPDPTLLAHAKNAGWPVLNLHTGADA
jgi:phosphoserine phosphatase